MQREITGSCSALNFLIGAVDIEANKKSAGQTTRNMPPLSKAIDDDSAGPAGKCPLARHSPTAAVQT
jgi:hypothetical protein